MTKKVLQDLDTLLEAADNMIGFCLACGHEQDNVEPDANNYVCDECGESKVFGAEELIIMEEHK